VVGRRAPRKSKHRDHASRDQYRELLCTERLLDIGYFGDVLGSTKVKLDNGFIMRAAAIQSKPPATHVRIGWDERVWLSFSPDSRPRADHDERHQPAKTLGFRVAVGRGPRTMACPCFCCAVSDRSENKLFRDRDRAAALTCRVFDTAAGWQGIRDFFAALSFSNYAALFSDSIYLAAYLRSLQIATIIDAVAARHRLPDRLRHRAWRRGERNQSWLWLWLLPFLTAFLIRIYAWTTCCSPKAS